MTITKRTTSSHLRHECLLIFLAVSNEISHDFFPDYSPRKMGRLAYASKQDLTPETFAVLQLVCLDHAIPVPYRASKCTFHLWSRHFASDAIESHSHS